MLIKKEEIKNKLCPIKFINVPIDPSCEGEKCMAWRTYIDGQGNEFGYCGLAGVTTTVSKETPWKK